MDHAAPPSKPLGGFAWAVLLSLLLLTLFLMSPPRAQSDSAAADRFSATRAMETVRALAQVPHPPGTREHDRVRDEIVARFRALGCETQVQKSIVVRDFDYCLKAATTENIIAYLPGYRDSDRLLLLTAHYDSHGIGPGAGDDAAGVAALRETARALLNDSPSDIPVAFLITDAEEQGLLGARAFVENAARFENGRFDPRKRDIIALNFEGRGAGGPVFMFETGNGNRSLIDALAATPRPSANSLMYALYRLLPNDTDLTVLKQAGMRGMNFAFADRWAHYHTALDRPEGLDPRSLQHHGEYAVSLVRRLRNDWPRAGAEDAIYFDLFGRVLIRYPTYVSYLLALIGVGLYAEAFRRRKGRNSVPPGFTVGIGVFFLTLVLGGLLGYLVTLAMTPFRQGTPYEDTHAPRWFEGAFFCLVFGAILAVWLPLLRRHSTIGLSLGALLGWLLLLIVTTLLLPGASYLFFWPLFFVLPALLWRDTPPAPVILGAIPTVILYTPIWHGLALMLGFGNPPALGVTLAFVFAPLLPTLRAVVGLHVLSPVAFAVCGVLLFVVGGVRSNGPRTNTLFFAQDTDSNAAFWATHEEKDDRWLSEFLGGSAERREGRYFYPWLEKPLRTASAPPQTLPPLSVTRNGDTLTVRSARSPQEIILSSDRPIRRATVAGRTFDLRNRPFCLRFLAPPDDRVTLTVEAEPDTLFTLTEYTFGLPYPVPPRPAHRIAAPVSPLTDTTLTRRTLRW
ncbi:MAG: M28 family peptidase [Capsulimonadales bacterium]|nr:M28 family peptidase [Capsulimonadales bacterium]